MAENLHIAAADHAATQFFQIRQRPLPEHGCTLPGRAGQHDDMTAIGLKGAAGGRAPVVHQYGAALRQHGLLFIVGSHLWPHALFQPRQLHLVHLQRTAEYLGHRFLGQIIGRRAQTAGGDEDVGAAFGGFQRRTQAVGVIPYHRLPIDIKAVFVESLCNHLGIGVDDLAHEQFGANG